MKKTTTQKSAKLHVKTGDAVIVIAGNHKGTKGIITKVFPSEQRVIIEGVNMVKKHIKPSANNPEGGIIEKEAPIHVSNVAIVDPKTGEPTRVGRKLADKPSKDGKQRLVRYSKKSGEII